MKEWLPRGIIHGNAKPKRKEPQTKGSTRQRKKAIRKIEEGCGRQWIVEQMHQVFVMGKQGFDVCMKEMGRLMAETMMYIEREEIAGPDYQPLSPEVRK